VSAATGLDPKRARAKIRDYLCNRRFLVMARHEDRDRISVKWPMDVSLLVSMQMIAVMPRKIA
jgi:hypothetical protein